MRRRRCIHRRASNRVGAARRVRRRPRAVLGAGLPCGAHEGGLDRDGALLRLRLQRPGARRLARRLRAVAHQARLQLIQRGAAARVRASRRMHQCRTRVRAETEPAGYFKTPRHAAAPPRRQHSRDAAAATPEQPPRRRRDARIARRLTRPRKRRSPSRRSTRTAASWSTPWFTPTAL